MASMPTVPAESPVLENLTYYYSKSPIQKTVLANGEKLIGSDFGGYHSVLLRNISFNIQQSMIVPCGYVDHFTITLFFLHKSSYSTACCYMQGLYRGRGLAGVLASTLTLAIFLRWRNAVA